MFSLLNKKINSFLFFQLPKIFENFKWKMIVIKIQKVLTFKTINF